MTLDLPPTHNTLIKLRKETPAEWTDKVLQDFDSFLIDHAAAEKKASGMAVSMLSHYPDKPALVKAMINLSIEEMTHFREVVNVLHKRGLQLGADTKDQYINAFRRHIRNGKEDYMLDRLLTAGIIEARGCERFGMVANALPEGELKMFYRAITESEARHENLFVDLAKTYFDEYVIAERLDTLLDIEADIVSSLPIIAALH